MEDFVLSLLWARRGAHGPPGTHSPADVLAVMTETHVPGTELMLGGPSR